MQFTGAKKRDIIGAREVRPKLGNTSLFAFPFIYIPPSFYVLAAGKLAAIPFNRGCRYAKSHEKTGETGTNLGQARETDGENAAGSGALGEELIAK